MDTIFTLGLGGSDSSNEYANNDDRNTELSKLNLDDLYEKKKQQDLNTLSVYNRILNRIHVKIKTVARQQKDEQFCWYVIPEIIIGVPRYDNGACIAYLIAKLRDYKLQVNYTHPNLLLVSWKHWIPGYVRQEYKKKMGIAIDGFGVEINSDAAAQSTAEPNVPNELMFMHNKNYNNKISIEAKGKDYMPINTYKPSGNLIYNEVLLKRIEDKSHK